MEVADVFRLCNITNIIQYIKIKQHLNLLWVPKII